MLNHKVPVRKKERRCTRSYTVLWASMRRSRRGWEFHHRLTSCLPAQTFPIMRKWWLHRHHRSLGSPRWTGTMGPKTSRTPRNLKGLYHPLEHLETFKVLREISCEGWFKSLLPIDSFGEMAHLFLTQLMASRRRRCPMPTSWLSSERRMKTWRHTWPGWTKGLWWQMTRMRRLR